MTEEAKKTEEEQKKATESQSTGSDTSTTEKSGTEQPKQDVEDVQTLKKQLAAAQARAATAEKERDEERVRKEKADSDAKSSHEAAIRAQEEAISRAEEAARSKFEAAQAEWDDAHDSGDKKRLKEATIAMNDAQMLLRGAEHSKAQFEEWKEKQKNTTSSTETKNSGDFFAVKAASGQTVNLSRAEKDFVTNEIPDFLTDPDVEDAVYDADRKAKRAGHKGGTPEYLEFIRSQMVKQGYIKKPVESKKTEEGTGGETKPKVEEKKVQQQQRFNSTSTAAPSSGTSGTGSNANGSGGSGSSFTLTPEMREAAAICYPELYKKNPKEAEEKYAKYQLELKKQKGN